MLRVLILSMLALLLPVEPVDAQTSAQMSTGAPVPDRRLIVTRDVDFYGSDLQALFDTTLEACQAVCLNDARCGAFTFNTRSNACFPKSDVSDRQPYEGAISGQVALASETSLAQASARAADLRFLRRDDVAEATRQAQAIGALHAGGEWTPEALLTASRDREAERNYSSAAHWMGAAVAQSDAADQWLDYARLNALAPGAAANADKRRFEGRILPATINAYLRAPSPGARVSALVTLARTLETQNRGREMIPTLRLAQTLQPRDDVAALLDQAIGKYGFRITEHRVDSDLAQPRVCAEFSEPLVRAGMDYAPFVKLPDATWAVEATETEICVTGMDHGTRLTMTFREGLSSATGEELIRDIPLTLYVRDRAPGVSFAGRAYVLPRSADAGIPVDSVNTDEVSLTLRRVSDRNLLRSFQDNFFGRPLSGWQENQFETDIAEEIWTGTAQVQNILNQNMTTRLPVGEIIADLPPGIYALSASAPGDDPFETPAATQWFVLSDLGVSTMLGNDGLHVFVRSLGNATALEGIEVTLVSRANAAVATLTTDAQGYARFDPGLTRGTGSAAPALITLKDGDADMAFLSLTDPAFDLSDRGVEGRPPSPPVDVFVATDRGAYRAGEVIHATALARDAQARSVDGLPLTAVLTRPDGVEYSRDLSAEPRAGGHVFALPLAPSVPRGSWRLAIYADPKAEPLASQTLLVEDFVPERIDFDLTLPDGAIRPANPPLLRVDARYLFGAPGGDLPIEGEVTVQAQDGIDGFPGYVFGRYDTRPDARTRGFDDAPRTDAAGMAQLQLPLPEIEETGHPFEARITLRLSEGSGRPVERSLTRALAPETALIGIKPLFDDVVPEGQTAEFDVLALGPDLQATPIAATWSLNRVETRYQWYQLYGNWQWEPVISRRRVAGGQITLDGPTRISAPVDWGRHELVVERTDGTYVASATDFHAGWYAPADTTATPDTLELSLDRPGYRGGDTATLRLVPRYAGTALVTVMSDRLIAMQTLQVTTGENLIALDVTDEWRAGAYVSATVLRPMDVAAGQNPARSLGLAYAPLDPGAKRLAVTLDAPAQSMPRGPLEANIQIAGLAPGDQAYVTVAAVDLGILNLTGFDTPDPAAHYFGQRRLGMEIRDIYGRLIDGMNGATGTLRQGGDAGAQMRMQSPPPTEELVAFHSGLVTVTEDGTAPVRFDMPEFNGTVRLMAMAWTATAVGSAEADVLVRDPVVVTASLPRFLAPGDQSRIRLEIVHVDGPSGRMGLDVSGQGVTLDANAMPSGVTLEAGGKASFDIPLTADGVGDHGIRVALTTPDGRQLTKSLTIPVRVTDPPTSITRRFALASGATFDLNADVFDGLRPGTAQALVSAGPLARFDAPGLIAQLDRYPYGCTEQVTSQAMPLLYFEGVAAAMGLGNTAQIQTRVTQAVTQVLTRQGSGGGFGMWQAEDGNFWLDAYVTDFLSRARAQGHVVPDLAFRTALDNLRNRISYAPDFDATGGGEDIAYALMVLAREGAANMGDLRYYADAKADDFATPMALAQLGAALAFYGDQTRADAMFAKAASRISGADSNDSTPFRADYGSTLRDAAGLLSLAVGAGSEVVDTEALMARVGNPGRALSTQEQSWALLAAHAMVRDPSVSGLSVDGTPVEGPFVRRLDGDALVPQRITNTGATRTDITLTTLGVPLQPGPAGEYGYAIERAYYTMEGAPLTGDVQIGDRLVTVLSVRPGEETRARLMVNDPLPAGFEIDNPNLLRAGDIRALDWLDPAEADHTEFRTDRFLAAIDWEGRDVFRLAYVVRAVSPGRYHHPAASVEDMYRPRYRANTDTGQLVILP